MNTSSLTSQPPFDFDELNVESSLSSSAATLDGSDGRIQIADDTAVVFNTLTETRNRSEVDTSSVTFANGSISELAEYLTDGFWEDNDAERRSFDTSSSNVITVNMTGLDSTDRALATAALEAWEMVADIDFQFTTSFYADITFFDNDVYFGETTTAYSITETSGNDITYSDIAITDAWLYFYGDTVGSYGFQTYLHEIGHALGLGHQSNYNGTASFPNDADFDNDSWQMSVMSYFSQTDNTYVDASYAFVTSAMMSDIEAIQDLYGAPDASSSPTAGATTWGANTNLNNYLGDLMTDIADGTYTGADVAFTIYDVGGTDTIDLSFSDTNDTIRLGTGSFSDILGLTGNVGIAQGTIIENVIAGSGNDTVTGNGADNTIRGRNGNDSITAYDGEDSLFGDQGNDTIRGGDGEDYIRGGNGKDTIYGGSQADTIYGDAGNDTVNGGNGADVTYLGSGSDVYTDTKQNDSNGKDIVHGGDGGDSIEAGGGDDLVKGNAGNDYINGETGNDNIHGGNGDDTIRSGSGVDVVQGGLGRDDIHLGGGNDTFYDEGQTGGSGADIINGGGGNDYLSIGGGNDIITGGSGNDTFVFSTDGDDNTITDFSTSNDKIVFDEDLTAELGTASGSYVVNNYGSTSSDGFVITVGDTSITFSGYSDGSDLVDSFTFM